MRKDSDLVPEQNGWLKIGKVGKPHGLRGAFFLNTPENRTHWDAYPVVLIGSRTGTFTESKVLRDYLSGGMLALQLENFTTREKVEEFHNADVFIHRNNIGVEEDDVLVGDLKGMQVYSEKGLIGEVVAVVDFGAQQNIEIELTESRRLVFFPLLEEFVKNIDTENKRLTIVHTPEFLDE